MIPPFHKFFIPTLEILQDEEIRRSSEIAELLKKSHPLPEEDYKEVLKSGETRYNNRVHWCLSHLKHGGLIESVSRGCYGITSVGLDELNDHSEQKDMKYFLEKYPALDEFIHSKSNEKKQPMSEITPMELIESAVEANEQTLKSDLMKMIYQNVNWSFFEHLVLELLSAMGYGTDRSSLKCTGKPGDQGIDGEISEDALGFDKIFIQAKHYSKDNKVTDKEIRNFIGSISIKGGNKGVFITTSSFTDKAIEAARSCNSSKIILIDGELLAQYMINNNVGVAISNTYHIKKVDLDFFEED
ncbi:restriction endonuclease [Candidatus Methanomassiliicoccus intestinalis]|uniref:restriction endonuclease n=1 Tax=Candidatus Methanomassiliicoccus intestinalis TaxID=1406512 RepID=UPI0037DC1DF0